MFVRRTPIPKEEQLTASEAEEGLLPKEPLRPGERVFMAGAGELKAALLDLEIAARAEATNANVSSTTKQARWLTLATPGKRSLKPGKG